jgi:hypothetical protein
VKWKLHSREREFVNYKLGHENRELDIGTATRKL